MTDGREFKGQHNWRWSLNKNFLTGNITSSMEGKKTVEAQFIVGWEPKEKLIKGWEFWRDGYRGSFVVTEKGTHLEGSGEYNDGPQTWIGRSTVSDDLNSYSYKASVKRVDGAESAFQFSAVKRGTGPKQVPGVPPKALKAMRFFVGNWTGETFVNGEKIGDGTDERKWMPSRHCILMSGVGMEDGAERHSTGLCGWDPNGKQLVETWHAFDGLHAVMDDR